MSDIKRGLEDVTVGIKTFERYDRLEALLNSLQGLNVREIIVADDSLDETYQSRGKEIYEKYSSSLPLRVLRLPYDSGLAYGRNKIYEKTDTSYLLLLDDDMIIPEASSILLLKDILEHDLSLCGLATCLFENGRVRTGGHFLSERKGYLVRDVHSRVSVKFHRGIPYIFVDHALNAMLLRIECLDDYRWDERFKIEYEHLDFHWGHKQLGRWKFALTTSVFFYHNPGGNQNYINFRYSKHRKTQSKKYFLSKWNLKGVISIQTDLLIPPTRPLSCIWLGLKKSAPLSVVRVMNLVEEYLS